jgi:hypothetical protein
VRTTVTQATQENQAPNATTPTPGRSRAAAVASAGPLLIVAVTLFVLRHYALEPRMDSSDMTNYWLPLHCFMGSTLRAGHIPGWNPFAMGGMPFAPDPQAGWMSLPAMAFFTALRAASPSAG